MAPPTGAPEDNTAKAVTRALPWNVLAMIPIALGILKVSQHIFMVIPQSHLRH